MAPPNPRISLVFRHIKTEISISSLEIKLENSTMSLKNMNNQSKKLNNKIPLKKLVIVGKI